MSEPKPLEIKTNVSRTAFISSFSWLTWGVGSRHATLATTTSETVFTLSVYELEALQQAVAAALADLRVSGGK